jgi:hypothetical protein
MDFGRLKRELEEGAGMIVMHPGTGSGTDLRITVAGMDSPRYRNAVHRLRREASQEVAKELGDAREGVMRIAALVGERFAEKRAAVLAAVTLGWQGITENDAPLACTRENATRLYEEHPWLADQVEAFMGDRGHFFRPDAGGADAGGAGGDGAATTAEGQQV